MYLLDTVVLSELRKNHVHPGLAEWMSDKNDSELFLSVLTIGEIRRGIQLQQSQNPQFSARLAKWLDTVILLYGERVLPVSTSIALEWGNISAQTGNSGADALIAATAKIHHLTVVTRNIKHFEPTGVPCLNPWRN
jgi:Predicted nucleic acid-binding protein, contains PIN domain